MNYDLSEEQNMLKDTAFKFLTDECSTEYVREMAEDDRGFSTDVWNKMAGLGWIGLLVPEKYGGPGMNFLDLAVLLSEMGYFCFPGPFFSTVVPGGLTLLEAGSDKQLDKILPDFINGKHLITLAWLEEDGTYNPDGIRLKASAKGDGYLLSGIKLFVPDAHVSNTIICPARTGDRPEDITMFMVDSKRQGLSVNPLETITGDKQSEVIFENVEVDKNDILGKQGEAWPVLKKVLRMSAVAKSAEMSGGARKVMETTVTYVTDREQFGRPVGSFQAIQNHCSNMLTYADTINFMAFQAAWRISEGFPFQIEASMCKAWTSESYRKLVALAHQCIGGMGFMEEYDLQLYFKRAKTAELMFGDADFHRELLASEIGL